MTLKNVKSRIKKRQKPFLRDSLEKHRGSKKNVS